MKNAPRRISTTAKIPPITPPIIAPVLLLPWVAGRLLALAPADAGEVGVLAVPGEVDLVAAMVVAWRVLSVGTPATGPLSAEPLLLGNADLVEVIGTPFGSVDVKTSGPIVVIVAVPGPAGPNVVVVIRYVTIFPSVTKLVDSAAGILTQPTRSSNESAIQRARHSSVSYCPHLDILSPSPFPT